MAAEDTACRPPGEDAAPAREARLPLRLYVALTILVWGLFAPDRGFWQDDARVFSRFVGADLGQLATYVSAGATPSRRLKSVIYGLAALSGHPLAVLHLAYGAVWLGIGLLAGRVARLLSPTARACGSSPER